jgi:beta-glucosidase
MYQKAGPSEAIIWDRFGGHVLQLSLLLAADGRPSLEAEYAEWGGIDFGSDVKPKPIVSHVEQNIDLSQQTLSAETSGKKSLGVEWNGL